MTRICHRKSTMMDTLPRVPDVNGVVDEKLYSDLYTRTSWVDASIALDQIEKVRLIFVLSIDLPAKKQVPKCDPLKSNQRGFIPREFSVPFIEFLN